MDIKGNVLITGIGGGYDVYLGLPLYFALQRLGHKCYLANFGSEEPFGLESVHYFYKVLPGGEGIYPEQLLANEVNQEVYLYSDCRLSSLRESYRMLIEQLKIETIIGIDGGCDSIMSGRESSLGTPVEDYMSIASLAERNRNEIKLLYPRSYIFLCGVDVEFKTDVNVRGINEEDFMSCFDSLQLIDSGRYGIDRYLNKKGKYLQPSEEDVIKYINIVSYCLPERTLVNSCVVNACRGVEGNVRIPWMKTRFNDQKFNIRRSTSEWYLFKLKDVISHNIFIPFFLQSPHIDSYEEIDDIIHH